MSPRLVSLVLALLLAAPVAHAASQPLADALGATGFALEARDGFFRVGSDAYESARPEVGFHLQAEQVLFERQFSTVKDVGGSEVTVVAPETEFASYRDVVVDSATVRPKHEVWALPGDGAILRVTGETALLRPAADDSFQVSRSVRQDTDPRDASALGTVWVVPEEQTTVTVTGDFTVSLWETDLSLFHASGVRSVESGKMPASDADSTGVASTASGVYELNEVLLHVRGGALRLAHSFEAARTIDVDIGDLVALHDPVLHADSALLHGVTGVLPDRLGADAVTSGRLELQGDLALALHAAPELGQGGIVAPLSWELEGRVDSAALDGTPLTVQVPAGPIAFGAWMPVVAPLFLVGLLVAGGPLRVRSARRRLRDAELLFTSGHFDAAAHAAAGAAALRHREVTPQALALRVQALLHAGRTAEARRLAADPALDRSDPILRRLVTVSVNDWRDE